MRIVHAFALLTKLNHITLTMTSPSLRSSFFGTGFCSCLNVLGGIGPSAGRLARTIRVFMIRVSGGDGDGNTVGMTVDRPDELSSYTERCLVITSREMTRFAPNSPLKLYPECRRLT